MAVEIERKFLVKGDAWRKLGVGKVYCQGYIHAEKSKTVRVRIIDKQGYLTIKGASVGTARKEFEYPIPLEDAQEMLDDLCNLPLIEKKRYKIPFAGLVWEVDEFFGENQGLIMAEVELTEINQKITLPDWIGEEVSHDPRYFNSNLAKNPYRQWQKNIS